jgi:6-phosphofructokinase
MKKGMDKETFKIAVLTSGADASGMNFAISAVTKYAEYKSCQVIGFYEGFIGLMNNKFIKLDTEYVDGLEERGGTFLYTARTSEFKTEKGINKATANLKQHKIDGLILIGGDGTFRGGNELHKKGINVVGIPASIYNDISGTDYSIGFDSALNTIKGMVSKIRDTASSHNRLFIIEVMGKNSGNIAINAGLACAVDYILAPEIKFDMLKISNSIRKRSSGKKHIIIMTAEGAARAHEVASCLGPLVGQEVRISVLGYTQRGGSPSAIDRILAARFAKEAVELLLDGKSNLMAAIKGKYIRAVSFDNIINTRKDINKEYYKLAHILSTYNL